MPTSSYLCGSGSALRFTIVMRPLGRSFGPMQPLLPFPRERPRSGASPSRSPLSLAPNAISHTGKHDVRTFSTSNSFAAAVLPQSPYQRKTIYALATPPGKAGVAVIRISGPDALEVYSQMVRRPIGSGLHEDRGPDSQAKGLPLPKPRCMERCSFVDARTGEHLDDGLAVYFKGPKSFTGEDVLELHTHSGRAIISSVLHSLSTIAGCRHAEPGEFTRRAFDRGRLELTQVEGLRDLINAETDSQRKLALKAAEGSVGRRFEELRGRIIHVLALVEAIIDFGEGEEIEDGVWENAKRKVDALQADITVHLRDGRRGEILRSGIRLAIFGPPNAGKSSLLNYLAQREAAIVTPLPGTTRDVLELSLDVGGMPVVVADTAGLRKTTDVVELLGIERAQQTIATSDIALCVLSLPEVLSGTVSPAINALITPDTLVLLNKSDLVHDVRDLSAVLPESSAFWTVSLNDGTGMQTFLNGLVTILRDRFGLEGALDREPLISQARHRVHLENVQKHLEVFMSFSPPDVVFAAEELRYAAQEIAKISGAIGVDDILDVLFRDFCIGK